jgi:hypothetical protein
MWLFLEPGTECNVTVFQGGIVSMGSSMWMTGLTDGVAETLPTSAGVESLLGRTKTDPLRRERVAFEVKQGSQMWNEE